MLSLDINGTGSQTRVSGANHSMCVAMLATLMYVGTGGSAIPQAIPAFDSTSLDPSFFRTSKFSEVESEPLAATLLSSIRSNFQLNAAEAAKVINVSRQTIYDWVSGVQSPQTANLERLKKLNDLGLIWRGVIGENLSSLSRRFADRQQLLAVLSHSNIQIESTIASLRMIADARQQSTDRRLSTAEKLAAFGANGLSATRQRAALEDAGW